MHYQVELSSLPSDGVSWNQRGELVVAATPSSLVFSILAVRKLPTAGAILADSDGGGTFDAWAKSAGVTYTECSAEDLALLLATTSSGWQAPPAPPSSVPMRAAPTAQSPAQVLARAKADKIESVDERTSAIIASGFTFSGRKFSASVNSQVKWLGMNAARDSLVYPVSVPSADDTAIVDLASADDVALFYAACFAHVESALRAGTALKQLIILAADVAALTAIVDAR